MKKKQSLKVSWDIWIFDREKRDFGNIDLKCIFYENQENTYIRGLKAEVNLPKINLSNLVPTGMLFFVNFPSKICICTAGLVPNPRSYALSPLIWSIEPSHSPITNVGLPVFLNVLFSCRYSHMRSARDSPPIKRHSTHLLMQLHFSVNGTSVSS